MADDAAKSLLQAGLLILLCAALPASGSATDSLTIPVAQPTRDADASPLLAAAEPFEALIEQAFKASPRSLDEPIAAADRAVDRVRASLQPQAASELDERLTEIHSARAENDRGSLALAAAEAYRILVSAAPPAKIPTAVNLLDYATFRYKADLRSRPVRWRDMKSAAEFAAEQWNAISDRVSDPALARQVEAVLQQMDTAVARKSVVQASTATKRAFDLVDKLEAYFSRT